MMEYSDFASAMKALKKFYVTDLGRLNDIEKILQSDGPIYFDFGHEFIDEYIKVLSNAVGDESEWINWWVFENDFGKKKLKIRDLNEKMKTIPTIKALYDIIKEFQDNDEPSCDTYLPNPPY